MAAYESKDYATALKLWRPLAEQGDAQAQYNLGIMYDNGQGVPQDDAEAVKWYRKAAEQGIAKAQYNLGVMYANGRGVPQDYAPTQLAREPDSDPQLFSGLRLMRDLDGFGAHFPGVLASATPTMASRVTDSPGSKAVDVMGSAH